MQFYRHTRLNQMSSFVNENTDILSKNPGVGGSGIYTPSLYESKTVGGKHRKTHRKQKKRKTRTRRSQTKRNSGVLGKAKKMLKKMFRL